jgi:hypothetical protein
MNLKEIKKRRWNIMRKNLMNRLNQQGKEVKKMKRILIIAVLCLTLGMAGAAQAFWVGSVFNGDPSVNAFVPNIMGFDWSSSGSGMANTGPAGTLNPIGSNFEFDFQASLVGVTDPTGASVTFPGLNSTFEYTLVAKVPETIVNVVPLGGGLFTGVFDVVGPGSWYLYYEKPSNNNVGAGTGFEDGHQVATGTFDFVGNQISTFTLTSGLPNISGIGSFILTGLVTPGSVDPAYLDPSLTLFDIRAEGTLNQPPLDSTTLGFFDTAGGPYARKIFDPQTEALFKADASSKFSTVVPEPSTILLLGAGLLGLVGISRRRK